MSRLPSSLLQLAVKRSVESMGVGTDICHVPRILRILQLGRPSQNGDDKSNEASSSSTTSEAARIRILGNGLAGSSKSELPFVHRIFRADEIPDVRTRCLEPLRGFWRARAAVEEVRRVRGEFGMERGEETLVGETAVSQDSRWREVMDEKGPFMELRLASVLEVLEAVLRWKRENGVSHWMTPWDVILWMEKMKVGAGRIAETAIADLRARMDGMVAGQVGGVEGVNGSVEDDVAVEEGLSARDEAQALEVQREEGVFERDEDEIMPEEALSTSETPSLTPESEISSHNESAIAGGEQDDMNAISYMESTLSDLLSNYHEELSEQARHIAGRFAAKEAIIKAFQSRRRLTFKDIGIYRQAPDTSGSRPPEALVIDEDGLGVTKVQLSISHDGEYATAVALVPLGDVVARSVDEGGDGKLAELNTSSSGDVAENIVSPRKDAKQVSAGKHVDDGNAASAVNFRPLKPRDGPQPARKRVDFGASTPWDRDIESRWR